MSYRKRQRRQERRAEKAQAAAPARQAVSAQPIATARPPAQRGTFRVSQALREAQQAMPNLLRDRTPKRRLSKVASATDQPAQRLDQGAAKRSPSRVVERNAPLQKSGQLRKLGTCKPRPTDTRPKSGGGSGRDYVHWCK